MRSALFTSLFAITLPLTVGAQSGGMTGEDVTDPAAAEGPGAGGLKSDDGALPEGDEAAVDGDAAADAETGDNGDTAEATPAGASASDVHLPDDIGVVPAEESAPGDVGMIEDPPQGTGDIVAPQGGPTPLSDFVDTRLSFSFSDDDFLAGPGDTRPNSPSLDFAPRRANRLFFENLNSRDSGQETLTHLVLYRRFPGYFRGVDTEAAFVLRFNLYANDETGKRGQSFYDDGTYIKMGWYPGGDVMDEDALNLSLTMFPFDTNRFRLGYLYDISWGGPEIFPSKGVSAPGAKLQLAWGPFYMYGGAKTARMLDETINEIESNWGFLGGLGIDILEMFTLEAGGGFFNRGTNPLTGVEGEPVQGYGGSGRAVFHYGTGAGSSVDFRLYRNDPATTDLFLQNREFTAKLKAYAALEGSFLQQTLQSAEQGQLNTTVAQTGTAAAFSTKLQLWYFDLGADFVYRDLAFVLFNRPSFVPFQAFPADAILEPELMFATSLAAHAPAIRSTFALVFGVQWPSTFTGLLPEQLRNSELPDTAGSQTVVVRNAGSVDILPCQSYDDPSRADRTCTEPYTRSPIYALRGAIKFDVSPMLSLIAETTLYIDNNQTDIIDDEQGQVSRQFVTTGELGMPLRFGAGLFAQARF